MEKSGRDPSSELEAAAQQRCWWQTRFQRSFLHPFSSRAEIEKRTNRQQKTVTSTTTMPVNNFFGPVALAFAVNPSLTHSLAHSATLSRKQQSTLLQLSKKQLMMRSKKWKFGRWTKVVGETCAPHQFGSVPFRKPQVAQDPTRQQPSSFHWRIDSRSPPQILGREKLTRISQHDSRGNLCGNSRFPHDLIGQPHFSHCVTHSCRSHQGDPCWNTNRNYVPCHSHTSYLKSTTEENPTGEIPPFLLYDIKLDTSFTPANKVSWHSTVTHCYWPSKDVTSEINSRLSCQATIIHSEAIRQTFYVSSF